MTVNVTMLVDLALDLECRLDALGDMIYSDLVQADQEVLAAIRLMHADAMSIRYRLEELDAC